MKAKIIAVGHYVPQKIVDNNWVSARYDIPESSIYIRSGIKTRHFVTEENTSDLVVNAVNNMLTKTNISASDIDCLLIGTITPESFAPSTSAIAIKKLGLVNAFGMDLSAACSGFCYALELANMYVQTNKCKNIIVCGAEVMSRSLNDYDYKTGILFGDGAGVVLLSATNEDKGIVSTHCKVVSDHLEDIVYNTPFSREEWSQGNLKINGTRVYKNGVKYTINLIREFLSNNNLKLEDFKYIVPHQSNIRMLSEIASGLSVDLDKFLINIDHLGNTASASIPICLSENYQSKQIQNGDRLLLCSFGAGYTLSLIDLFWTI